MASLVLDLGKQDRFALQCRRARQPVALGLHTDNFGMGMLRYLPDQRLAVGRWHPVLGFDLFLGVDAPLKGRKLLGGLLPGRGGITLPFLVQALRVHVELRGKCTACRQCVTVFLFFQHFMYHFYGDRVSPCPWPPSGRGT